MTSWLIMMTFILMWWHPSWHWFWAGVIALLLFPLKKLLDYVENSFWQGFKAGFLKGFKQTPFGKSFTEAFEKKRAEDIAKMKAEYPDYKPEE